jgi:hypothetical protein
MDIRSIFRAAGTHLHWHRLPDDHVVGSSTGQAIEPDQAYFLVRLNEMYLGRSRTLWRKFYPLVHGFSTYGTSEEHAVAGPGQLRELGESNLDRVLSLNTRLAGPIAFKGGDVSILVGLYSVPGDDAARALIATVGAIANLPGIGGQPVAQVVSVVKSGVDSLLGLQKTRLRLGVGDTFYRDNPLRSGFHVGIGAPEKEVDLNQLWLRDGRLVIGADPIVARPYEDHDYMVLQVEHRDHRKDWTRLPGMVEFDKQFADVVADGKAAHAEKLSRLAALWPTFTEALRGSSSLTARDASRIADNVSKDLRARVDAIAYGNPFETKSPTTGAAEARDPTLFDLAEIPDYRDPNLAPDQAALQGNPF